jgi:O-antigen ligase
MIFSGWLFYELKEKSVKNIGRLILISGAIIISLLAIWFAHSEGALVGLMAGAVILGLFANKKLRLITIGVLILAVVLTFTYAPLKTKVLEKITLSDLSGEIKQQQWKETFKMLRGERFFTGAGLNGYQAAIAPYHQEGIFFNRDHLENFDARAYASAEIRAKYWQPVEIYLYPHNILLNFWSELGLAGALLFIWIILKYLYTGLALSVSYGRERRTEKYLTLGLMTAMIAIIVHGLVDAPYFKNDLAAMFWILVALLGIFNLRGQKERELK